MVNPRRGGPSAARAPAGDSVPLHLSFGNFDFQEMKSVGQRGGGVRELATLLRRARRQTVSHSALLRSKEGVAQRNAELLTAAMQRASGEKVRDDPKRLAKAMAKRRNKKRQSAKKWAQRIDRLQKSVDNVVEDRAASRQMARARRDAKAKSKTNAKDKSMKQNGKGFGGSKSSKKQNGKSFGGSKSSKKQSGKSSGGSKWSKKSASVKGKKSSGGAKKGGKRRK